MKAALRAAEALEARPRRRALAVALQVEPADTRPSGRSAATAKSSPSTASSRAAWSATGSRHSPRSPNQAELTLREQQRPRALTPAEREQLLALGGRPRPRVVRADNHRPRPQAAPAPPDRGGHHRRPTARSAARQSRSAGRRRDHRARRRAADHSPRSAPTRTRSRCWSVSPRTTPTSTSPGSSTVKAAAPRPASDSRTIIVGGLRRYRNIPATSPPTEPPDDNCSPRQGRRRLGVAASTCTAASKPDSSAASRTPPAPPGESASTTSCAPCSSRTPRGLRPDRRRDAILGVSRQTVLQRVKRGDLQAIHVRNGRRKGLKTNPKSRKRPLRHHPHERPQAV